MTRELPAHERTDDDESLDMILETLASQRQRYALQILHEYETSLALADLAEEVAIREHNLPITEISAEEVKRIYMSLYHNHIPNLEDATLVRYSQDADRIALGESIA